MKFIIMLSKVVLFLFLTFGISNSADPLGNFCNKGTEIGNRNKLAQNIKALLPELVEKASKTGHTVTFYGKGQDKAYGLAQCRRDVTSAECSTCLKAAADEIQNRCPNEADARIWYDYCFLRHSENGDFVGQVDTSYGIFYTNVENVTEPSIFNAKLGTLMGQVRKKATALESGGIGKGDTKISPFLSLYALGQCTEDLSPVNCAQCLAIAVGNFPIFCKDRKGCRVLYSNCYVRYELYPFFFPLRLSATKVVEDRHGITVIGG